MAHFAQIDGDNTVIQVIVVNNSVILDENGIESEVIGVAFCRSLPAYGPQTNWKQTSYSGAFRKNYAGAPDADGRRYIYDPVRDAFIAPQPFPSWTLNEETCRWEPLMPYPNDGKFYQWDEQSQTWIEVK